MARELEGLEIPNFSRDSKDVNYFLPHFHHPETSRPITRIFLGLVPVGRERFYPVEMDLINKNMGAMFVYGDDDSEKEEIVRGILRYAGDRTVPGYLKVNIITRPDDPYKLAESRGIKRHLKPNDVAHAPEGVIATVVLNQIIQKLETKKPLVSFQKSPPHMLLIDDLGYFLKRGKPENIEKLKKVLAYRGKEPFVTIAMVEEDDLDTLEEHGIGPDIKNSGMWLIGKSDLTDKVSEGFPKGYFMQWDSRKKKLRPTPIVPFED